MGPGAPQIHRGSAREAGNLIEETGVVTTRTDGGPYYRHHVFCCVNERPEGNPRGCCARKGAVRLRNYMKGRAKRMGLDDVRINAAGCLDRCELGPTLVVYPEGIWYRAETKEDVEEILAGHIRDGMPVGRLMLGPREE